MLESQKLLTESEEVSVLEIQKEQKENSHSQQFSVHRHSKAQNLIGLVTHHIEDQIQQSRISISQKSKPFQIQENPNHSVLKHQNEFSQKKIAEFVKKRHNLQQQIIRLKFQQEQEKHKIRSRSPLQESHSKPFRSYFTQKQHVQISRIKKQVQDFEHNLQVKDKQLVNKMEQQHKKQVKEHKDNLQKLKEKKKQQARKHLERLHQQQKQRLQRLKQQNKKFQQVKNGKSLHEKIEQYHKHLQNLKKSKQKEILNQKRKQMMIDMQQIKKHEKKYYQAVRLQKQKLALQAAERARIMKQKEREHMEAHKPSKFLTTLFNQQKQRQLQDREKIQKVKSLFNRRNSFQNRLRELHKELIKPKSKPSIEKSTVQIKSQQRRIKAKSLSAADIYKQGQIYMREIHSNISSVLVEQSKFQLQQNYKSLKEGHKIQYKNYLEQSKLKRQTFFKSTGRLSNPQIQQLKSIIQNKQHNATDKLFKAKLIANKLDQKAKNSTTRTMVNSIAAKIKIIEEFS